jgi:hypothetical protein
MSRMKNKKIVLSIFVIFLYTLSIAFAQLPPRECIEGQKYAFGKKLCTCVNGKIEEKNCVYCEWGVTTDENGTYVCAEPPSGCIPEGHKKDNLKSFCCEGLLLNEAGVCVRAGIPLKNIFLVIFVITLIVITSFVVYKIGQKK